MFELHRVFKFQDCMAAFTRMILIFAFANCVMLRSVVVVFIVDETFDSLNFIVLSVIAFEKRGNAITEYYLCVFVCLDVRH